MKTSILLFLFSFIFSANLARAATIDFTPIKDIFTKTLPDFWNIFGPSWRDNLKYMAQYPYNNFNNFDKFGYNSTFSLIIDLMNLQMNSTLNCNSVFSGQSTNLVVTNTMANLTANVSQCSEAAANLYKYLMVFETDLNPLFNRIKDQINETVSDNMCLSKGPIENVTDCIFSRINSNLVFFADNFLYSSTDSVLLGTARKYRGCLADATDDGWTSLIKALTSCTKKP